MRTSLLSLAAACLLIASAGAHVVACAPFDDDDCEAHVTCAKYAAYPAGSTGSGGAGGSGGHGGGTAGGGGMGDGGGGGVPVGCVPSENDGAVSDSCGVFVSSSLGDDSNEGSKSAPLASLAVAIAKASSAGMPLYACAETFTEAVILGAPATIYGGLDCAAGWAYVGPAKKTTLLDSADEVPLRMSAGADGTTIYDFAITAADATVAGGSSIAIIAEGVTAELVRCDVLAGNGAAGLDGADAPSTSPPPPPKGNNGDDACSAATVFGGAQVTNDCSPDGLSIGGKGGDGNQANGGSGQNGQTGLAGLGGIGEPAVGAWSCVSGAGQGGDNGTSGTAGAGASGPGTLTSSGYLGTSGTPGTAGAPGQGGGGGGGAKGGGTICSGGLAGSGASGGSGGAGGCGGQPGGGAGPGGASIALVSLNATVTLTDCTVTAGKGGDGGKGGDFQAGASGGLAGVGGNGIGGSLAACDGGKGGQGGNGGPGGGGLGGASFAVAYVGTAVVMAGDVVLQTGAAGPGGPGGNSNVAANAGDDGAVGKEQSF